MAADLRPVRGLRAGLCGQGWSSPLRWMHRRCRRRLLQPFSYRAHIGYRSTGPTVHHEPGSIAAPYNRSSRCGPVGRCVRCAADGGSRVSGRFGWLCVADRLRGLDPRRCCSAASKTNQTCASTETFPSRGHGCQLAPLGSAGGARNGQACDPAVLFLSCPFRVLAFHFSFCRPLLPLTLTIGWHAQRNESPIKYSSKYLTSYTQRLLRLAPARGGSVSYRHHYTGL